MPLPFFLRRQCATNGPQMKPGRDPFWTLAVRKAKLQLEVARVRAKIENTARSRLFSEHAPFARPL
jgi:hypothetical protein